MLFVKFYRSSLHNCHCFISVITWNNDLLSKKMFPANKIYNVRDWEIWDSVKINSVQIGSTRTICPSDTFWSGTLGGFALKNQTRNNDKTHKDFWFFHAYFLCQNVRIFSNYILFTQKINLFWSGSIRSIRNIKSSSCFTYFLIYILW